MNRSLAKNEELTVARLYITLAPLLRRPNNAMTDDVKQDVAGSHVDRKEVPSATLSVDQLTQAFAHLMGQDAAEAKPQASTAGEPAADDPIAAVDDDDDSNVSAQSVLEAILFVGHPENEPLTSRLIASYLRGVTPAEVDELVKRLNQAYQDDDTPFEVVSDGSGYRLALRSQFENLRERFYGRVRQAKLSQVAIDLLAIVAYNQPIDRQRIETLQGRPCGAILNQLVRRELLQVERGPDKPRKLSYKTTGRFLDLFRLDSLDDLPSHDDFHHA